MHNFCTLRAQLNQSTEKVIFKEKKELFCYLFFHVLFEPNTISTVTNYVQSEKYTHHKIFEYSFISVCTCIEFHSNISEIIKIK